MRKINQVGIAIFALMLVAMACGGSAPASQTPTTGDQLATVVAATLQAANPSLSPAPDSPTSQPAALLPHSLYFLNNDSASGAIQVFRLAADGKTTTQITFEPSNVDAYSVSQADGSVAYVSNNQLLLVNADGSGRRTIVDGGAMDANSPFVNQVSAPVFSPDGQTLAYGYKGLNLYSLAGGSGSLVLENQIDNAGGLPLPKELYAPDRYSPDGNKLLVNLMYYEGGTAAVYVPASNALIRLTGSEGALTCCGESSWTLDSAALYSASREGGMLTPGMWRSDASSGQIVALTPSDYATGMFNYAYRPYLAPDGQLYFFFNAANQEYDSRAPLQMMRSAPDGVTNRAALRSENFGSITEALWAPDASFVIVADPPVDQVYRGGLVELYYTDGQKAPISLAPFGMIFQWGP